MSDPKATDEAIRLRVSAIVTAIMSFRVLRGIVLRSIQWDDFQDEHVAQFEAMVRDLYRSNFLTDFNID